MNEKTPSGASIARLDRRILQYYSEWARTRFWLIPTSMCVVALLTALLFLYLDSHLEVLGSILPPLPLDPVAARGLLGVIATSVISVGGVSFSITMVALSLTSGQYGPKVMRHFLASVSSKLSIGLFFSTALFALTVFVGSGSGTVPRLSMFTAMLLGCLTLIEFMRFIHRTSSDLQADQIIQRLGRQLRQDLRNMLRDEGSSVITRARGTRPWRAASRGLPALRIGTPVEGYVQTIDYPGLVGMLEEANATALLRVRPGSFLVRGQHLLTVYCAESASIETLSDGLQEVLTTGEIRTAVDDPQYPISQIQQIAARALSPGVNDPGTAISCIDSLTLALREVVDADFPGTAYLDRQGRARLLVPELGFASLVDSTFSAPRQLVNDSLPVADCILHAIARLMELTLREERIALLRQQADLLMDACLARGFDDHDLASIRQIYRRLCGRCAEARRTLVS